MLLAAILAIVGIYGMISYMVVRRRNEIGVRIALGAGKANILGMIMHEALALLIIGLVAGTVLAAAAGSAARAIERGDRSRCVSEYRFTERQDLSSPTLANDK